MLKILEPNRKTASQGSCKAPLKKGSRIFMIPARYGHLADHHQSHRLPSYFVRTVFPFATKEQKFEK
jgi:hypothetical protein